MYIYIHMQMKPGIQERRQKQIKLLIWGQHGQHRECQTCKDRTETLYQTKQSTKLHTHTICGNCASWQCLPLPDVYFSLLAPQSMWVACYFWCAFPCNYSKHPCAIGTLWDTPGTFSVRLDTTEILLSDSYMKIQLLLSYLYFKLSFSLIFWKT